jgi:hypothetical protein
MLRYKAVARAQTHVGATKLRLMRLDLSLQRHDYFLRLNDSRPFGPVRSSSKPLSRSQLRLGEGAAESLKFCRVAGLDQEWVSSARVAVIHDQDRVLQRTNAHEC